MVADVEVIVIKRHDAKHHLYVDKNRIYVPLRQVADRGRIICLLV